MTALQAYEDTMNRARYFIRLYDGLINIRRRKIRADWRNSFCLFMKWPQGLQINRVDTRDALIILRDKSQLDIDDFDRENLEDLLRSAVVLSISALDRYVHERVIRSIVSSYKTKANLTREQRDLNIPIELAFRMISHLQQTNNTNIKQLQGNPMVPPARVRPANEIRNYLQEYLHRIPFQNFEDVCNAFRLIGRTNVKAHLQQVYRHPNTNQIAAELNKIVDRRNKIVHEGDLYRRQRGGALERIEIEPKFVNDSVVFIDQLINHLEQI